MTPEEYAAEARNNGLERFEVVDEPAEVMNIDEYLDQDTQLKKQRLEAEIHAIDQQIEQREALHEEIADELEFKLDVYEQELEHMESHFRGGESGREEKRKQIRSLRRQLHDEHRKFWNDVQRLQGQKRKLQRKIQSVEDDKLSEYLPKR